MKFDFDNIEQLAQNFIPEPTGNKFLDARYEWQKYSNGVEWPYYRFFYQLTKILQPRLVVELGGYQGTGAAHFAGGCSECSVITIDHHTDPGDELNQERMIEVVRNFYNVHYIQGWTTPKLAKENKGKHALGDVGSVYEYVAGRCGKIDILFIDSWHIYEYVKADYEAYHPLMNSPGLIICDDIIDGNVPGDPIRGMMQFWNELLEPKFLDHNLHPGWGMGFVKV